MGRRLAAMARRWKSWHLVRTRRRQQIQLQAAAHQMAFADRVRIQRTNGGQRARLRHGSHPASPSKANAFIALMQKAAKRFGATRIRASTKESDMRRDRVPP